MQTQTKNKNNQIDEYQCIFYNSPFEWNEILACSNLKVLIIIGQAITDIDGVDKLSHLEEIWVIESGLENANAALKCTRLGKLYLYSNKLSEIPYVFVLKYLKVLWLSENNISVIANIIQLDELKELNLAGNNITEIGDGLLLCGKLETLNLAGNPICNLLSVADLKCLSSLRNLLFYDPLYCITPITKYINYRSYIIKTLPQLKMLDDFAIQNEETVFVSHYYSSRDLYYSIQYHTELYKFSKENAKEKELLFKKMKIIQERIFNGMMMLKKKSASFLDKYNIEEEVKNAETELSLLHVTKENWMEKFQNDLKLRSEKLHLEQKFFGNLKFVDISDNKNVLKLLQNILKQSVCPSMTRYLCIKMIQAFQIVDCRTLLKGINCLLGISNGICDKGMDFFILNEPLGVQDSFSHHFEFLDAHFQSKKRGSNKYTVTNSVAIADRYWLNLMHNDSEFCGVENSRILMLVYTLKNSKSSDSSKNHTTYLNNYDVCNYHYCIENKVAWNAISPVFIIEYQYKFKITERDEENLDLGVLFDSTADSDSEFTDVSSDFQDVSAKSFRDLDRSLPLEYKCISYYYNKFDLVSWANLTSLDITRACITSFGPMSQYPNIVNLNVSYNKIASLLEISLIFPQLVTLIASYNLIKTVKPLAEMKSLKELDLSSNQIKSFINSISWLRKSSKALCTLKLNYNPFVDVHKTDHMSLIAKRCYPSLMSFNDTEYSEHEITSKILRIDSFASFKQYIMPKNMILERNPSTLWNRDSCNQLKKHEESTEDKENFYNTESHVTLDDYSSPLCLYICNCEQVYCSIMLNSDISSLRYLTVTQTFINSVVVNNDVSNLEELDISFNMIVLVNKTLFSSEKLVRLNLMGNYLTRLNFFNDVSLPSLKYINVSRNFIQCFQGIERFVTIEEVHMTTNLMTNWHEVRIFKNCPNLKVIDIRGNPVDNMETAKKFLIFHSHHLKYINGESITESDLEEASVYFKGILDQDYLLKEYSPEKLKSLTQLTVANSSLKQVMLPVLDNLTSLNLEHNNLTTYKNLADLKHLKYLCLSNNHVTSFGNPQDSDERPIFNNLQVLYLNMNHIKNLVPLELKNAPKLVSLFLQDNELTSVQGLNTLQNLNHLVLDRNKIRVINPSDIAGLTKLKNLNLEYNLVNCLKFLKELKTLRSLFLAYNKVSKYDSLQNFTFTNQLRELTFHGNPICRYSSHYAAMLSFLPEIHVLDGIQLDRNKLLLWS